MSAQQFADTPRNIGNEDGSGHVELSIQAWGDYHDVYEWLLPTNNRKQNPLFVIRNIAEYLENTYTHQETLRKKDLGVQANGQNVVEKVMRTFRLTEFDTTTRPYRYRNPSYEYYEERTQPVKPDDRAEWWDKWRYIPTIDTEFVAHHWGVQVSAVRKWLDRNGYLSIAEQWDKNERRFARTLWTCHLWTDRSLMELVDPLPVNYSTMRNRVNRHARNVDDWKPPQRPSNLPRHHAQRYNHE